MKRVKMGKKIKTLNPIMTFIILILVTILLSGILSAVGFETSYTKINALSGEYETNLVTVESLLSFSGLKYIFGETVSNFVSFTPFAMMILILIGIGIMEQSGFLKTAFTLLTKYTKKNTVTFLLVLVSVISSLTGDLGYVIYIPLGALLFKYGKRNPLLGIIASFAGLVCGSGISVFLTSVDSSLLSQTTLAAHSIDASYKIGSMSSIAIMLIAVIGVSLIITFITEKYLSFKLGKYEVEEEKNIEQEYVSNELTRSELRGLIIGIGAGLLYLLIIIYNIIPGLPLSGNLLDNSQALYIDKLFGYNSFFNSGFVFVVTVLFIILGLFYGVGSKNNRSTNDFCEDMGHTLDGIGKIIILLLMASIFINVFKKTNIGNVLTAYLANLLSTSGFSGLPLLMLVFLVAGVSTIFLTSSLSKWSILSATAVQLAMHEGLSPISVQLAFRFGESFALGLTPLCAYFVIYLAFLEKYNPKKEPISLFKSLKYISPYAISVGVFLLLLLLIWFITGLPVGIGSSMTL